MAKTSTYPAFFSWHGVILTLILVFAFFTRVTRLGIPSGYMFDEVYHAVTAKLIAANDPRAYEWWNEPPEPNTAVDWLHPPFAKLTQAASMKIFGVNSVGWRMSSVIFGTAVVGAAYWLARTLKFSPNTALLAAFLASLDGLLLTMSRIAMNDVHVTFFIILTAILYWRWKEKPTGTRLLLTATSAGLAAASKWSGFFVVPIMIGDQVIHLAWSYINGRLKERHVGRAFQLLSILIFVVPLVYIASYAQTFLQGKNLEHLWHMHQQIWWYQTGLDATHPYQSTPLQWFLDLRPVYAYADFSSQPGFMHNIYIFGNPILFWSGGIAALWAVGTLILFALQKAKTAFAALRARDWSEVTQLQKRFSARITGPTMGALSFVVLAYFATWLPWAFSPRIMFFYHYTPAVPLMSILLAFGLQKLTSSSTGKIAAVICVAMIALTFGLFFPHWTALPVPIEGFLNDLYFLVDTWR